MKPVAIFSTNRWNRFRYTLYAPGYDLVARIFSKSRNRSIRELGINPGDEVLIVGAGTGLDLEFITEDCHITATDITPAMISHTLKKNIFFKRNLLFSNITRHFENIISETSLAIESDIPADLNGNFRIIRLRKS